MLLHEGDRIAADAQLTQGDLWVDESLLTGESLAVLKSPGMSIFASTVVTKGSASARVEAIGAASKVGRIGASLASTTQGESGLTVASHTLVRTLTLAALALASALVLVNWLWDGRSLLQSLLTGIALAMAILPEEIPFILTIFLALGAWRIAKLNVLTRRIPAVEALGTITVLAVDKTGTLTQNRMQIAELSVGDTHLTIKPSAELPEQFHGLIEFAMLATPNDPFDPMEIAIQTFGQDRLAGTQHIHDDRALEFHYDLSHEILAMTGVFSTTQPALHQLATKGAPEAIADLCHLSNEQRREIAVNVETMAKRGLRVLGVARGEWHGDEAALPKSQHDFDFTFLGLIGFLDPPREDVRAAIAECRAAGVRVLMLTGDHPATASAIAQQVGLSERPDVITGAQINSLDDASLRTRLAHADLCARLEPEQKLRLVRLLQDAGEIVAMTGDGVNDGPALKAADVGIAMGGRGTDVAREAAGIVLLDDSFASIVAAIDQGRRIFDNITKATRFVFAVHMPIIALALLPALFHWPILILPVHIVVLQLLIDPACSIVFEAEPAAPDTMRRPPRSRTESPFDATNLGNALLQGFGIAAILLASSALLQNWGWTANQLRTGIFLALLVGVLLLILSNRDIRSPWVFNFRRGNPWLVPTLAVVSLILAAIFFVPFVRAVAGFAELSLLQLSTSATIAAIIGLWLQALRLTSQRKKSPISFG